jgi:hypothetical protein
MCGRSTTSDVNYSDKATFVMHKGTPDEAITYMLVHKVKAAEACRKVDFCKMKLSRCIQELKESGQWEEHCADLLGHAQRMNACTPTAEAPAAAELEMATPRSLGAAIASGATHCSSCCSATVALVSSKTST